MQIKHHDPKVMALMQLETALAVYFQGKDLYSVITLAGAADEIFGRMLAAKGLENHLDTIKKSVAAIFFQTTGRSLEPARVADRANRARNALKHWNSREPAHIDFDAVEEAKDMLDRAISNYWTLEQALSPLMTRFQNEQFAA